jgi:hypothetical protein
MPLARLLPPRTHPPLKWRELPRKLPGRPPSRSVAKSLNVLLPGRPEERPPSRNVVSPRNVLLPGMPEELRNKLPGRPPSRSVASPLNVLLPGKPEEPGNVISPLNVKPEELKDKLNVRLSLTKFKERSITFARETLRSVRISHLIPSVTLNSRASLSEESNASTEKLLLLWWKTRLLRFARNTNPLKPVRYPLSAVKTLPTNLSNLLSATSEQSERLPEKPWLLKSAKRRERPFALPAKLLTMPWLLKSAQRRRRTATPEGRREWREGLLSSPLGRSKLPPKSLLKSVKRTSALVIMPASTRKLRYVSTIKELLRISAKETPIASGVLLEL